VSVGDAGGGEPAVYGLGAHAIALGELAKAESELVVDVRELTDGETAAVARCAGAAGH
jgi:hypothetical protein